MSFTVFPIGQPSSSANPGNSGLVLEKVCEYFYYNEKHKDSKDVPDMDIPAELCLELLMAADYFDGNLFDSFTLQPRPC